MGKILAVPILVLVATILMTSTIFMNVNALTPEEQVPRLLTPEDNEAKQDIIKALSDAVDHRYSKYDMINVSRSFDNSTFTIYNKSGDSPEPPLVCGEGTHEEDGICIPDEPTCPEDQVFNETSKECEDKPIPPEPPVPSNNKTTIGAVGDIVGSASANALDAKDYDYNVALGDMGYKSDLDDFMGNWNKLNNHRCVIGNHDSREDGSSTITEQAKEYCTDIWIEKIAGGTTVMIGVNTNGNLDVLLGTAQEYVMNEANMVGVKNVILFTHKPCVNPPNSHHGLEDNVLTLCDSLEAKTPDGVNFFKINGHNHVAAFHENGLWYTSGAGHRSHYECSDGNGWKCNNEDYGYLELTIDDNTGKVTAKFFKTGGGAMF